MSKLTYTPGWWLILGTAFLTCAACTHPNRLRGGGDTVPPTIQNLSSGTQPLATDAPANETSPQQTTQTVEAQPQTPIPSQTVATQPRSPTQTPTENVLSDPGKTQGDELERELEKLDQMNQSADALGDMP